MRLLSWIPGVVAVGAPLVVFSVALGVTAATADPFGGPAQPRPAVIESSASPSAPPAAEATSPTAAPDDLAPTSDPASDVELALEFLSQVPVTQQEADGYVRDAFGQRWADTDRNGCDTRNDILGRDLVDVTFKPGTRDCVVLTGVLRDAYSGTVISFTRGSATSEEIQVDHVIPLAWAWRNGASAWSDTTRTEFANDPINLRAVDGPTNMEKSDLGPSDWLPANSRYRCDYALLWVAILDEYPLTMPADDRGQLIAVLREC